MSGPEPLDPEEAEEMFDEIERDDGSVELDKDDKEEIVELAWSYKYSTIFFLIPFVNFYFLYRLAKNIWSRKRALTYLCFLVFLLFCFLPGFLIVVCVMFSQARGILEEYNCPKGGFFGPSIEEVKKCLSMTDQ